MKIAFIVVAVVLAVFLFRILRSSSRPAGRSGTSARTMRAARVASTPAQGSNAYRAVSVKCGRGACDEVLALGKRRFFPEQLGKLPLADCTSLDCQCKFQHHPDRRDSDGDKRAPTALRSELHVATGKPERRTQAGRRKGDFK